MRPGTGRARRGGLRPVIHRASAAPNALPEMPAMLPGGSSRHGAATRQDDRRGADRMGERLSVDTDALRMLGTDLRFVAGELWNAQGRAEAIAGGICHDGLARAVLDFAASWDDTRRAIVEQIAGLAEAATALADTFSELDTELAASIRGTTPS